MVGGEVLRLCIDDTSISKIVSIGRRPTGLSHPKLEEITHDNFLDFSTVASHLKGVDICFYCIGVYQNDVDKDTFWRITCDYQEALLKQLEQEAPGCIFCLFGAQGASPEEKSWFRFGNAKGRAERMLLDSALSGKKYIFRPGYIHPSRDLGRKSAYAMISFLYRLFPSMGIDAIDLARVMIETGLHGSDQTLFENSDLRRLCSVEHKSKQDLV